MSRPQNLESLRSLAEQLLWGMQQYGVGSELFGATAYVGFNLALNPKANYFYCDGTADDVQINAAEAYVTAAGGGTVELEQGTYDIVDPIIPTGNSIWYKGQGEDTFLDGDGLATTEHVFHVTGRDDIRISDMSMQTSDGVGNTCHCIFIEDGSDRFLIENITILDSDSDGIHVEGTSIYVGHIHSCKILDVDDNGIYLDMDDSEYLNYLKITECEITGAGERGIMFADGNNFYEYCLIQDNTIHENAYEGIYGYDLEYSTIGGNTLFDNDYHGIILNSGGRNTVVNNVIMRSGYHGIYFVNQGYGVIDGNTILLSDYAVTNTYDGINIAAGNNYITVSNNQLEDNRRYGIYIGAPNTVIDGNGVALSQEHGIVIAATDCVCSNNVVDDNGQRTAGTYHGINLTGSADRTTVEGNICGSPGDSQEDGIYLETGCHEVLISGNYCYNGMGSGITLVDDNDYVQILGNYLNTNDDYGIEIITANSASATVKNNYFLGNGTPALLNGTNIKMHEMVLPFVNGTLFLSDDTQASVGWEIDLAGEYAATMGWIPNDVFQVSHLSIWGVSLVEEADAMRLQIMLRAGLSNEAYNAEDVTLASHASDTTNFAIGDVIYWFVTPADDTDLDDLMGGDALYVKVEHAAAGNGDCETDAVLYCATIGYV